MQEAEEEENWSDAEGKKEGGSKYLGYQPTPSAFLFSF